MLVPSGGVAKISGETVYLVSGQNTVEMQAFDLSGAEWRNVVFDNSGTRRLLVSISGQSVNVICGTGVRVSGETVAVTSGTGVRVSGETITFLSGIGVRISGEAITFLSGIGVRISGEAVTFLSGIGVRVSGESVRISPESGRGKVELHAYDLSGLVWTPLAVDTSGGTALKIAGSF